MASYLSDGSNSNIDNSNNNNSRSNGGGGEGGGRCVCSGIWSTRRTASPPPLNSDRVNRVKDPSRLSRPRPRACVIPGPPTPCKMLRVSYTSRSLTREISVDSSASCCHACFEITCTARWSRGAEAGRVSGLLAGHNGARKFVHRRACCGAKYRYKGAACGAGRRGA